MKNKTVGILIIGIASLVGYITFSFNRALTEIANSACSHGIECPMWDAIGFQTNVSIGIIGFIIIIGLYLIFFAREEKILDTPAPYVEQRKITKGNYQKIINTLTSDEKLIFEKIIEAKGAIFQSNLVDNTEFNKVKITRILDKLEGKNLVERRRRGMSNIVILKH